MDESYSKTRMLEKRFILGVGITNGTKRQTLEYIIKGLEKNNKKYFVVTPNPEILILANKDKTYKDILNNAQVALPDGVGVTIAGKILGIELKGRVTGVELLESLCLTVAEKPIYVGFLGGRDRVAEKTAECLVSKYPGLKVVFVGEEWPIQVDSRGSKMEDSNLKMEGRRLIYPLSSTVKDLPSTFYNLPSKSIDILFVAFGAPKQEIWISQNLDKLPVRVAIGVGGAFDYISRKVQRAPIWVQKLGFEWLFRLVRQPWRIKRQLALLEFSFLVLKEKFGFTSK